ncbi:DUF6308 family protein [Citricoccus muralis]|uniref:DUF6308 family protein n=1 Tax=Citricoccus muralis TaxID=169134 RepID=A0ABY8H8U2_9MICC|nr:DUF6308 family protein [Citricoccus muralis]WFP17249.1 DUF6308 family protein [Citricoccus muralis]
MGDQMITVGGRSSSAQKLLCYAEAYLTEEGKWAYPAYDSYESSTASKVVGDADLLAVSLLNAGQKPIPTFYTFRRLLAPLNERLADPALDGTLEDAGDETLDAIADLFGVLDEYAPTPQVGKTKLSKVLHRKLPALLPLFDKQVWRTYSEGDAAPLPKDRNRSHRDYVRSWLPLLQEDLTKNRAFLEEVTKLALPDVQITRLRALDIIAWHLGGK